MYGTVSALQTYDAIDNKKYRFQLEHNGRLAIYELLSDSEWNEIREI